MYAEEIPCCVIIYSPSSCVCELTSTVPCGRPFIHAFGECTIYSILSQQSINSSSSGSAVAVVVREILIERALTDKRLPFFLPCAVVTKA